MKVSRVLIFPLLLSATLLTGCPQVAKDVADASATFACIVSQVDKGNPTFESIAASCGVLVVQDVVDVVSSLLLAETAGPEGAVVVPDTEFHKSLIAVHHITK